MANKRMISMTIVDSDVFTDMPLSSQCLYFHLNMKADDDGFVGNPKRITRSIGATDDDLNILKAKKFILAFDSGVIVIKHWRMHNTLSYGRYHETSYLEEKSMLLLKDNGAYSFTHGVPIDDSRLTEQAGRQSSKRIVEKQRTNADKNSKEDISNFFESVWKLYPIKKGKGQVSISKKKELQKIGYEQIARCVERFIGDMQGRDKQYWMHGSTFFNSGYVDYLDENYDSACQNSQYKSDMQQRVRQ